MVRCLLHGMGVPKFLAHGCPHRHLPYQSDSQLGTTRQGHPISFSLLISCSLSSRSPTRTKLDDKVVCYIFLRYSSMSKGYRCYDSVIGRLYHSLYVTFWRLFLFFPRSSFLSKPCCGVVCGGWLCTSLPTPYTWISSTERSWFSFSTITHWFLALNCHYWPLTGLLSMSALSRSPVNVFSGIRYLFFSNFWYPSVIPHVFIVPPPICFFQTILIIISLCSWNSPESSVGVYNQGSDGYPSSQSDLGSCCSTGMGAHCWL